ncbi:MAG: hypothetical protein VB046_09815 [Paludibacter sp.]|nr:hypothetical protein [Paludibacter sp.]
MQFISKTNTMTITVKKNIETPTGKRLEKELRQYPEVVEFVESPLPIDSNGNEIPTISFGESAKLAFNKLGEKYNCRFENIYIQ